MDASQFAERVGQIRKRFATNLAIKIEETNAALPFLTGDGSNAVNAVAAVYRRFHDVCGTGPTIGFTKTGQVARTLVDNVLISPFRGERGLTEDELAKLKDGLDAFRIAARLDTQSTNTDRSN